MSVPQNPTTEASLVRPPATPGGGLILRVAPNGKLDVDSLEHSALQAGDVKVTEWIRARLAGHDPYRSLGDMEAPESLLVAILRQLSVERPLRQMIERSLGELIDEALHSPPAFLNELLWLVRLSTPESCRPALERIACERRFTDVARAARQDCAWLSTAAAYTGKTLQAAWLEILEKRLDGPHVHIAYLAVARDPELALVHLPALLHALSDDERTVLIGEELKDAHERFADRERFLARVMHHLPRYRQHPGLVELVAESMQALGLPLPREVLGAPPEPSLPSPGDKPSD